MLFWSQYTKHFFDQFGGYTGKSWQLLQYVAISCQNWPLSRLADLCWEIPQEVICHIDSRSFS